MIDKFEVTVHNKTLGLDNSESYVLTYNRFSTYLVINFSNLNTAQIFKTPYRNSPHLEIELLMKFTCLTLFEPNEHSAEYYNRGPNDKTLLFENEDKN